MSRKNKKNMPLTLDYNLHDLVELLHFLYQWKQE